MKRPVILWGLAFCLFLAGCSLGRLPSLRGTKPIVKIGLLAPFEGRYRSLGYEVLYAVKWAVRQRNEAGGVAGYMVELVALNDADDLAAGSAFQAAKFALDERVMGVVGPFSEAAVLAAASAYHELGLALITPATCWPALESVEHGAVFCLGADVDALSRALVERLPSGASATLLRAQEGPLGDRLSPSAQRAFVAPWDEATFNALRERPADVYLYDGDVLTAVDLLIRMRQAGIDAPLWAGPSLARTQLPQIAGDATAGVCYVLTAPLWADLAPDGELTRGYRELAGTTPGPWAALAYDATVLLLDALQRAIELDGRPTREGMIARLADVRGPDERPVFEQGRRRQVQVRWYCYEAGEGYPGTLRR